MKFLKLIFLMIILTTDISAEDRKETIEKLTKKIVQTEYKSVSEIIISIAVLESAWFQSKRHKEFNNYFSIKDWKHKKCSRQPIYCLKQFSSIDENLDFMINYFREKGFPTEKESFIRHLKKVNYAEDELYEKKLRAVEKSLRRIRRKS